MKCFFCEGTGIDAEKDNLQGVKKCVPCNSTGTILRQYLVDNIIEAASNHFPYWRANGPSDIEQHKKAMEPLISFLTERKKYISIAVEITAGKEDVNINNLAIGIPIYYSNLSGYNYLDFIMYLKKDGKCEN